MIKLLSALLISGTVLCADNVLHPGTPVFDRPTLITLGIQLPITGDDNFNSSVSVQFRLAGTTAWQPALPMFRVHPETVADYAVAPQFGTTIFDLRPNNKYEIQLHAVDPDGTDETFMMTGTTRPVPAEPVNPKIVNVNSSAGLASALWNAQPGQIITIANGFYAAPGGTFQISAAGTAANPIVIRGASEAGVVLDGGDCSGCNVLEIYGTGYVHVENLTLQNAWQGLRFQQSGSTNNVVRYVTIKNTVQGIGGRSNHLDFYIADNILQGRLPFGLIYRSNGGANASNDGIAVFGFGHVVSHNRVQGYGDALKTEQDGARSTDFYGNEVVYTYDNAIELDGSEGNVRCFRNRFMNASNPISVQPIHGGPAYIFRNVVVNLAEEQLKFHANLEPGLPEEEPSGVLVYNNTFVSPPSWDLTLQTNATSHYFAIENNLFMAPATSGPEAADWTGPIDHGTFDYNGYFPNGIFRFNNPVLGGYFFQPNFAGLQSLGMETHGLIASGKIFANGLAAPSSYGAAQVAPADVTLASGAVVIDKALLLPNINDHFVGKGPDLGALELGCPEPSYGPRAAGVDETNEIFGCVSALPVSVK